jgi:Tol biopolymer transport system component
LLKPDVGPIGPIALLRNGSFYYSAPVRSTEAYVAEIDAAAARVVSAPAPLNQRFTGAKTSAVWSPEGESLAYVVAQRGRLCILSMDTHKVNEIVPKMGSVGMVLKWHPDGKSVFVLGSGNDGTRGAYRVSLDDGSAQAIAPYANDRPAWSPDANMIYYGGRALFARDVSTGKITELYRYLTADAFNNPNIDVSPDGRQLAVMLRNVPAGHCSIAILPATGGEPKIIYSVKQAWFGGNTLAWTRDGKHILAAQIENNRSRIMSISVATGEAKPIGIDMAGIIRGLRLNPDGKRIAFLNGDEKQEIWVMENFLDDTRGAR